MAIFLTEQNVNEILDMRMALEAVEEGFRVMSQGMASNSPRSRLPLSPGAFNFMTAVAPGLGVMGLKAYGITPGHPVKFHVQLSSTETGELLCIMEASALGQVRTGAASGVATKYMARENASSVGVIGAGYQARSQLEAVCAVRDIKSVKVFSRTPERRETFASAMSAQLGVDIMPAGSAEECVADANVIITITNSASPVLLGEWIAPGAHINAAGANNWMRRELDDAAVARCEIIVTDDVAQAKMECGDLIYPAESGQLRWEQVRTLSDVIAGRTPGRTSDDDITLFESQGLALEDIATGIRVYQAARERGIGTELPF